MPFFQPNRTQPNGPFRNPSIGGGYVCSRLLRSLVLALLCAAQAFAQDPVRVVHVFVALADNQNQGIVPVPARLGNGTDPENNLYWGSAFGVKTFFARSVDWRMLGLQKNPKSGVLQRCVFKHRAANVYLVADAYQGDQIRQAILDFLGAAAGESPETIAVK